MSLRRLALLVSAAATFVVAPAAPALANSDIIGRNVRHVSLKVDRHGRALATFASHGTWHHVLVWGGVNARYPTHGPHSPQARFHYDYSGGSAMGRPGYWKTMRNACRRYDGPRLHWLVASCRAPDGSYWALQSWQRALPNVGAKPHGLQSAWELHVAHWKGALPHFWIKMDWAYCGAAPGGGCFDHLFGALTYRYRGVGERGMYGFTATSRGAPTDPFGVLVFLDTHDSGYGRGWRRYNSWLTHNPRGARRADGRRYLGGDFCAGLFANLFGSHEYSRGDRYRATVAPPGTLPALYWEGPPPGPYRAGTFDLFGHSRSPFDRAVDEALNQEMVAMAFPDDGCSHPH